MINVVLTEAFKRYYRPPYDEALGLLPEIFDQSDPRPASAQIEDRYAHGGGYLPFGENEWKLTFDRTTPSATKLKYPGDPELSVLAFWQLNDELVLFFPHELVAIIQPDESFVVVRMS